ncbi:LysR family transcriptional regulator [Pseudoalteromonas luteoviolacea]|uniref:LysR family transcriptional regulator n=1 Tax=Pseudoalteromonas luteoviolacea TaxID=43657 RepID=UPI001B38C976|nr:LysR family transcriptional regulator [Pseudoalteromonas luteoviolacea]MBQ4835836.1 LysR family transcriptional regulator [Pseudoalteromonas luteoviolacea]
MLNVSMQALRVFEAAARHNSFKLAAQELNITPTAVSHHIKNLEVRLGIDLFIRKTREITPTKAGFLLAQATHTGFGTIERAVNQLVEQGKVIQIHTTSSFAAQMLIPALRGFNKEYPNLEVSVATGEHLVHDSQAIAVRFGDTSQIKQSQLLSIENFNAYGNQACLARLNTQKKTTMFIPKWKNTQLPSAPWQAWLAYNDLDANLFEVVYFDQELYCIQEAIAGSGLVFASYSLVKGLIEKNVLTKASYRPVGTQLGYYVPLNEVQYTRQQLIFINWLKAQLSDK